MALSTNGRVDAYLRERLRGNPHAKGFAASRVRAEILEYLAILEEDIARKETTRRAAHWNLSMLDDVRDRAAFVVTFFDEGGITLMAGQATSDEVRRYCEQRRYPSAARAMKELPLRLGVSGKPIRVACRDAEKWLGRRLALAKGG